MATKAQISAAVKKYRRYKLGPRAALVASFIETYCTYTKGSKIGQPFRLLGWQLKCLRGMYPGNPGDPRIITRVLVSIARKNGKTEFASALVLVHLCGPEAVLGGEIICAAAASQDQASLVWTGAVNMAKQNPAFNAKPGGKSGHTGMTYLADSLVWEPKNTSAKAIGTKGSSAQGLIPAFWTFDEIAETHDRKLYEALNYADAASDGLGFIITTRSTDPDSLFSDLHDEAVEGQRKGINKHWYVQIHSADATAANPFTMTQVRKANPALKDGVLDEAALKRGLENAKANPSARAEFRARILNIDSGQLESLIDPTVWANAGVKWKPEVELYAAHRGEPALLGLDLGHTSSMTCLAVYWPLHRLVSVKSWMARSQVDYHETIHKAPYREWALGGYLDLISSELDGGMSYAPIAEHIALCFRLFDVKALRFDNWNIKRLDPELERIGLHKTQQPLKGALDAFIQGTKSYGEAILEFEDGMFNGWLKHDSNPVTTLGVNACQVHVTNRASDTLKKPVKNKQKLPNDPAVALLMAIAQREYRFEESSVNESVLDAWYDGAEIEGAGAGEGEDDRELDELIELMEG